MVADPDQISQDFIRAKSVATDTSQYQWNKESFTRNLDLERGTHVKVMIAQTEADLAAQTGKAPVLKTTSAFYDPDMFQVPYDMGLTDVTGTEVTWDSKYPELVMITFSFQYVRRRISSFGLNASHNTVRTQIRLSVDGVLSEGAGVYMTGEDGSLRGTGYAARSMASCLSYMTMLPAGTHSVVAKAGQSPCTNVNKMIDDVLRLPLTNIPDDGVCIGNREMIVMRFARGKWLGA